MPYQDLIKSIEWSIALAFRGLGVGHPSRRTRGVDEAKATLLASKAVEQLKVSGYVPGHREHPVASWVNGGPDIAVVLREERPQPSTDWMLPTSAKKE
ncbi:hypothetical protein QFZ27_001874 [Inquilinus ginsengisoli]|uniref:hypothetical protein n=1 Tax=Inquilinus ginsengisoli TaxID=363840 RepID=UPI003D1F3B8F